MMNTNINEEGIATEQNLCGELDLSTWKSYFFTSEGNQIENKYGTFRIIKKILTNDSNKPNLVAMAGFSTNSFCGTTRRIIENINKIENKFNAIYVLQYDEAKFKALQKDACGKRDTIKETGENDFETIYQPETDLNDELGKIIDKLFRSAGLTKVHLLGKCAGGGVAIHVFTKSNIYDALYLGVPASPTAIKHITDNIDTIHNKQFIFGWDQRDEFKFNWGKKSNEEFIRYIQTCISTKSKIKSNGNKLIFAQFNDDNTNISRIEYIDNQRDYFETNPPTDVKHEKDYHEVPHGLFNLIAIANN